MNFHLRPEDLSFLDRAPDSYVFDALVEAPRAAVFAAIGADPSTWTWFPKLSNASYEGAGPRGVGSRRRVDMAGTFYRETMIAWEEPSCWAYRVDESSVPLAHAPVEEWALFESEDDRANTIVRWTFAIDPKPLFTSGKVTASALMGSLFRRAMANLSGQLNTTGPEPDPEMPR